MLNGIVSVPVMVTMMLISANRKVMARFAVTGPLRAVGWLATGVMALAALGTIVSVFI